MAHEIQKIDPSPSSFYPSPEQFEVYEKAEMIHGQNQREIAANEEKERQYQNRLKNLQAEIARERGELKVTDRQALSEHRRAKWSFFLAIPLLSISAFLVQWSLAPTYYGKALMLWIIAVGSGLTAIVGTHLLLTYLAKKLTKKQLNIFITLISLVMFTFLLSGFVQLAASRGIQEQIQRYETSSALEAQAEDSNDFNIEEAKQKIDNLNSRAMVMCFAGLEWFAGLLLFGALLSLRLYGPMASAVKERNKIHSEIENLRVRNVRLENTSKQQIGREQLMARKKESNWILITAIVVIVGTVLFFLLFTSDSFGAEKGTYYLVAYDVTGSTEHDRLENQRAVLKIIDNLEAGDEIQIMLITETTFSNPEYMIFNKMPSRAGYFNEELKRKKIQTINEFRKKAENLSAARKSTSLIDGIYMFARMCQEHQDKKRVFVMLSDMRQFSQQINEDTILQRGCEIISILKGNNLIPDMRGIDIYVMGASTVGLNVEQWSKLESFWKEYFAEAQGNLKCYDMGRRQIN